MAFKSFIKFLIDPFNILWLLALASFFAWYVNRRRLLKILLYTLAILFLLFSTPLIPVAIINSLEDQYQPLYTEELTNTKAEYHIIVLGGGHGFDDRLPPNSLLSRDALGRLSEGIRLQRILPNSKLVLSGYSSSDGTTQAEMLQQTARLMGIENDNIIMQKEPGSTFEEAEVYANHYADSHPVILVTSAAHMPRAMLAFRQKGITPLASPTNYRLKGSWKRKWIGLPSVGNIESLRVGISEYAGMAWYHLWY